MSDDARMARVLIAEDDPLIARLIREVLLEAGHEIEWVSDGLAVRSAACWYRPEIILLDIGLPSRSGLQVLGDLRDTAELADIPVVVVTAWLDQDLRRETVAAGAVNALSKPFSNDELVAVVRSALAGVRATPDEVGDPVPTRTH